MKNKENETSKLQDNWENSVPIHRIMPAAAVWLSETNRPWEEVLQYGERIIFKAKEIIPPRYNKMRGFYYLCKGNVKACYALSNGNNVTMYNMRDGVLLYNVSNRSEDSLFLIHAITKSVCYFFKTDHIFTVDFASAYPHLILNFSQGQSEKTALCIRRIAYLSGYSVFAHACILILELMKDKAPGISQEEMASILGIRRSWLCKILKKLKDEGIIEQCTKSKLTVLDKKKLLLYSQLNRRKNASSY